MTPKRDKSAPRLSRQGHDRLEDRLDRRAQALRANLLKRKEQVRARQEAADPQADGGRDADGAGRTD